MTSRSTLAAILLTLAAIPGIAVATDSLRAATKAVNEGQWAEAVTLLSYPPGPRKEGLPNYLLAICFSKLHKPAETLSHALAAVEASSLDPAYRDGARALMKWAKSELISSRGVRIKYVLSTEAPVSKNLSQMKALRDPVPDLIERANVHLNEKRISALENAEHADGCGIAMGPECTQRRIPEIVEGQSSHVNELPDVPLPLQGE